MVLLAVFLQGIGTEVPLRIVPDHVHVIRIAADAVVLENEGRPMQPEVVALAGCGRTSPGEMNLAGNKVLS